MGVQGWNRLIAEAGYDFRVRLPSTRFHGAIGVWAGVAIDPERRPITEEEWRLRQHHWLPSAEDRGFVASLMRRVTEPGKVAGWIAPAGNRHQRHAARLRIRPLELIRSTGGEPSRPSRLIEHPSWRQPGQHPWGESAPKDDDQDYDTEVPNENHRGRVEIVKKRQRRRRDRSDG